MVSFSCKGLYKTVISVNIVLIKSSIKIVVGLKSMFSQSELILRLNNYREQYNKDHVFCYLFLIIFLFNFVNSVTS